MEYLAGMVAIPREIEGASIVLVGNFNPAIFQPAWLVAKGLLPEPEGAAAEIQTISAGVTAFSTSWLNLLVLPDRFTGACVGAHALELLRDLVVGAFSLLEHTPVRMLGLNRQMHFRMPSEESWHALGDRLAPKEPWTAITPAPKLRSITMELERDTSAGSVTSLKLESSTRVPFGIYVEVNRHFAEAGPTALDAVKTVRREFDAAIAAASRAAQLLVGGGT